MKTISVPYYDLKTKSDRTILMPVVTCQRGLAVTPRLSKERTDAYEEDGTVLPLPSRVKGEDPPQWVVTHVRSGRYVRPPTSSREKAKKELRTLLATGIDWSQDREALEDKKTYRKIKEAFLVLSVLSRALLEAVLLSERGVPAGHLYAACGMGAEGRPNLDEFTIALRDLQDADLVHKQGDWIVAA